MALAAMTVALQVRDVTFAYLGSETLGQMARHRAVLEGRAIDPWQYRILTDYIVEGFLRLAGRLHLPHPVESGFIAFRILQNAVLFVLAGLYYRRLGLDGGRVLLGLSCLAWGMTHANYNSDLQFSTYSDVVFYLAAAHVILRGAWAWIPPLALLASLNRETSVLLPALLAADALARRRTAPPARPLVFAAVAAAAWGAAFVAVRLHYGPRPSGLTPAIGWSLALHNLERPHSWIFLAATFGLLPLLAIASYRTWPLSLRAFGWTLVPAWLAVHAVAAVVAETRLFLVPAALVVVPAALFAVGPPAGARGSAGGIDRAVHDR